MDTTAKMAAFSARAAAGLMVFGMATVLAACGGGDAGAGAPGKPVVKTNPGTLEHVQLPLGGWTGNDGQHLLRNSTDWERAWDAHNNAWPAQPAPPLPHVDFHQHMLVGVTSSYGGCSGAIAILSAEVETTAEGSHWRVQFQVDDRGNDPGMLCTTEMKPMADFVLLPQSAMPVNFFELPRLR